MEEVNDLGAALSALLEKDPVELADGETLVELHRCRSRLEALVTKVSAAFRHSPEWAEEGAKGPVPWITQRCRTSAADARRALRVGRALEHLPLVAAASEAGELSAEHVGLLVRLRRPRTEEALARDEALLVGQARELGVRDFARVARYWLDHADPDGAEERTGRQVEGRSVWLTQGFSGAWLGRVDLDPVSGAVVANELRRLEEEQFLTDWAEARETLGRDPRPDELGRTPAQRRADALVEMATRSRSTPPGAQRPAPLLSVIVGWPTLAGPVLELANGEPLTPGCLLPFLERADLERVTFTPGNRVEVSETVRYFTGAIRRAVMLRDRRCTHPLCDVDMEHCEVDHVVPASKGGPTTQENGRLLCSFHNKLRNRRPDDGTFNRRE